METEPVFFPSADITDTAVGVDVVVDLDASVVTSPRKNDDGFAGPFGPAQRREAAFEDAMVEEVERAKGLLPVPTLEPAALGANLKLPCNIF